VIDGDVEESLYLALVEIHGQDAVGAGDLEHVGYQLGADRLAAGALLVLAEYEPGSTAVMRCAEASCHRS
jgi:hypothetical protein